MSIYFKAKIISLQPYASGQDVSDVIEQVVTIELPDGTRFGILDGFEMQVEPGMIGQVKDISLLGLITKVETVPEGKPGIYPSISSPLSFRRHKFLGRIIATGVKDIWHREPGLLHLICVDVGFADILVNLRKETFQSVKVGDFIEIVASMTTLLRIK